MNTPVPIVFDADDETKRKLRELADTEERSMAAMLRFLIRQEYERKFSNKQTSQPVPPQAA